MKEEARAQLTAAAQNHEYMSVAIRETDEHKGGCFVPWESTSSAYNMRLPKITLSVEDLKDETIMQELKQCELRGLYIFAPLEDYGFIGELTGLWDLMILRGENVKDLSFTRSLTELFLFYLEDASVPDLTPFIEAQNERNDLPAPCLGLYHCQVEDTSALEDLRHLMNELLIWPVEGDTIEHWKRFGGRRPMKFRFYRR